MSRRIGTTYSMIYICLPLLLYTLTIYTEAITHFTLSTDASFATIEDNSKATLGDRAFDIVARTIATGIASLKSWPIHRGAVRCIVSEVHGIPLGVSYITD